MKTDDEKIAGDVTRDDLKTAAAACRFKARRVRESVQHDRYRIEEGIVSDRGKAAARVLAADNKADKLERSAFQLEVTADTEPRFEFGDLGGTPPIPFQDGWIYLVGFGCKNCGNGFWTEDDEKRRLTPGTTAACPHCGTRSKVAVIA